MQSSCCRLGSNLTTQIVLDDDHLPMQVTTLSERDSVLAVVWLSLSEQESLAKYVISSFWQEATHGFPRSVLPLSLPWSQGFYLCCQDVLLSYFHFISDLTSKCTPVDPKLHSKVL